MEFTQTQLDGMVAAAEHLQPDVLGVLLKLGGNPNQLVTNKDPLKDISIPLVTDLSVKYIRGQVGFEILQQIITGANIVSFDDRQNYSHSSPYGALFFIEPSRPAKNSLNTERSQKLNDALMARGYGINDILDDDRNILGMLYSVWENESGLMSDELTDYYINKFSIIRSLLTPVECKELANKPYVSKIPQWAVPGGINLVAKVLDVINVHAKENSHKALKAFALGMVRMGANIYYANLSGLRIVDPIKLPDFKNAILDAYNEFLADEASFSITNSMPSNSPKMRRL